MVGLWTGYFDCWRKIGDDSRRYDFFLRLLEKLSVLGYCLMRPDEKQEV